jgi:hypothetical protein
MVFTIAEGNRSKDVQLALTSTMHQARPASTVDCTVFEPQYGVNDIIMCTNYVDTMLDTLNIKSSKDVIRHVEGVIALFVSIKDARSLKGVVSSVILYVRSMIDTSVAEELLPYILSNFGLTSQLEPQSDGSSNNDSWINLISNLSNNWKQSISNGLFTNLSKLLGVLVISGLCKASDLTFKLNNYTLLEPNVKGICTKAGDLVPAVCDLVIYFTESVYACWRTGSLVPLWASSESVELEIQYAKAVANWDLFRNGNLTKMTDILETDYYGELQDLLKKIEALMLVSQGFDKRLAEDKYRQLNIMIQNFTFFKIHCGFRRAPFVVEYFGDSGVGKSTVCEQVSQYLFLSQKLDNDPSRKYNQDGCKKHWDGVKSDVLEVKIDDFANTRADKMDHSPTQTIINICNNVPFSPPMASLNEKGKIFLEPELVSITTNVQDLDARYYSNNPHSIQRRAHYVLDVSVKTEFQNDNKGVDTSKVVAHYTENGIFSPPLLHDIWEITVI